MNETPKKKKKKPVTEGVSTEVKAHYACTAFSGFVTRSTHNEAQDISIQLVIVPLLEFCSEILPCLRLFFFFT